MRNRIATHKGLIAAVFTIIVAIAAMAASMISASPTARAAAPQAADLLPYTIVASTGAVDEAVLRHFAFNGSALTYRINTDRPIEARYNVTNPRPIEATPGWTVLELGSNAPAGSTVGASLFRVEPCTGREEEICTTVNNNSDGPVCTKCEFAAGAIDFANYLYYVRIRMSRGDQAPSAYTIRLY
ncbi:MAG TPA: hypothetical protein VNO70_21135 [Blastocatellia bacterium]|nr:hypothetical protein [Blastocatellia bacterium]